jgi:DNA-binding CsgD family transcriptional regulator
MPHRLDDCSPDIRAISHQKAYERQIHLYDVSHMEESDMFRWAYLTPRQRHLWGLKLNGLTESEISRREEISRQSVHIILDVAQEKVSQALREAAEINRIEVKHVDFSKGILAGKSLEFGHKVVVTYSPSNGIRIWYAHEDDCEECKLDRSWVKVILEEAQERHIELSEAELRLPPHRLAKLVFSKMLPGVKL